MGRTDTRPGAKEGSIDISSHATAGELACLAEGTAGSEAERLHRHLAHCRECFQAFADTVEARACWIVERGGPSAPPDAVEIGVGVASGSEAAPGVPVPGAPAAGGRARPARARSRRRIWPIVTAVAAASVLAVVWSFWGPGAKAKSSLRPDEMAHLRAEMARASVGGLVYPGIEGIEVPAAPTYRNGNGASKSTVDGMATALAGVVASGRSRPDDLFWLAAAYLIEGHLDQANLYLRRARAERPEDPGILKLSAIHAYRESRLDEAAEFLRSVLQQDPEDAEALANLRLVEAAGSEP